MQVRIRPMGGTVTFKPEDVNHTMSGAADVEHAIDSSEAREQIRHEVLNQLKLIAVILDSSGRIAFCNDAFIATIGLPRSEIIGKDWFRHFTAKSNRRKAKEMFQSLLKTGDSLVQEESEIYCSDKRIFTISWNLSTIADDSGKVTHVVGIGMDVTENRKMENALRENEETLRTLINGMPDIVCFKDGEGRWIEANEFDLKLFELEGVDYRGKKDSELAEYSDFYHDAFLTCEATDEACWIKGTISRGKEVIPRPDGSEKVFDVIKLPMFNEDGSRKGLLVVGRDITEGDKARRELERRERDFRATFEQTAVGIGHIAPDGNFLRVNNKFCEIVGYERDELLERGFSAITHPGDVELGWNLFEKMKAGELENATFQKRYLRPDGTVVWVDLNSSLTHKANGEVDYFITIISDVTERKQVEQNLIVATNHLKTIYDSTSQLLIAYMDRDFNFIRVNRAYAKMDGYEPDAMVGLNHFDLYPDEDNRRIFQQVVDTGESYYAIAKPFTYPDHPERGTTYWDWNLEPVKCETGEVTGLILSLINVTERIDAEHALWQSENLYRTVVNTMSEGIMVRSKDGTISAMNESARRILNRDETTLDTELEKCGGLDKTINEAGEPIQPGNCPGMKTLRTGIPLRNEILGFPEESGRITWISVNTQPIYWNEDSKLPDSVVFSFTDITQERELQSMLIQSQKLEAVGRLAGGVAHDFNNLLTAILGNAELAFVNLAGSPEGAMIEEIISTSERAADLVRQLLAFSKRQPTTPQVIGLNSALGDMHSLLNRILGEHITLKFKLDAHLDTIKIDPTSLEQIVVNLVVNARDAMSNGGLLTIESANVEEGALPADMPASKRNREYVGLRVIDDGAGMSPEVISKIFEPFFSTKEEGKGTGLGLATVYGVVEQVGGHINVESEEGVGTTFTVLLPISTQEALDEKSKEEHRKIRSKYQGLVLVVEDDVAVRRMVTKVVRAQGFDVLETGNPSDADEKLAMRGEAPLLVISDVVMPGLSGPRYVKTLVDRYPDIKVLLMSGYLREDDKYEAELLDDINYLAKPFTPVALANRVGGLINT